MKKLWELLHEARPEIIGGLILELVSAVIGVLISITALWFWAIFCAGVVWLACAYVLLRRTPLAIELPTGVECDRKPRKYSANCRRLALAGCVIIPLLSVGALGYKLYTRAQPPDRVIVLVADFDGPELHRYRVGKTVWENLNLALQEYDDVQVERLEYIFETSAEARATGEKRKATIVIWGWYGATMETVPLSVHFEILRPPEYLPELGQEAQGLVQTAAIAELEGFSLQTQLSSEMIYLSLFTVGIARYTAKDWDGAITCFSDALSQTAERVPALDQSIVHYYRGIAHYNKYEDDLAIADFDQAIRLNPDYTKAYNNRGGVYCAKGNCAQAITDYDRAIALQPDYALAYFNRGGAYIVIGEYDQAIADYSRVVKLQSDWAMAYSNRGAVYKAKGNYNQAIADFNRAIKLEPDEASFYFNRGNAYRDLVDYDRAIADFNQAIELDPNDADSYITRGAAHGDKGDLDQAIADFTQAIKLEPNASNAYSARGIAYADKGDFDQAIVEYTSAIKLDPIQAEFYFHRGNAYAEKGIYDQAIADYNQAITLKPDLFAAYTRRGRAHADKGDYDQAIIDCNQAIQLNPDAAKSYWTRGTVYESRGDHNSAIANYTQAIRLDPDYVVAYFDRGFAYDSIGEREKAIADFKRVLEYETIWRPLAEAVLRAWDAEE